jgi:hypothetical protein
MIERVFGILGRVVREPTNAKPAVPPPRTADARWVPAWRLVWIRVMDRWWPGIARGWMRGGPDQPWLVVVEYALSTARERQRAELFVYDARFIQPMPLPAPPSPWDRPRRR